MHIDYPSCGAIPGLRELWKEAFSDTDAFLDAFFETGFSPRRCRCVMDGGQVLAALYWFEGSCEGQRFAYLYVVATAVSHRGRGLFGALLADTEKVLTAEGFDGILLVPQTESLGRMYEKFGFSPCTAVKTREVCAASEAVVFRETGPAEFAARRRELLPAHSVLQEGETLTFLASQCRFWAGEDWLAVGQIYEGKLVCQEFLGDASALPGLLWALGIERGSCRMPGTEAVFAYLLPLRPGCVRPQYFGLALD